MAIWPIGVCILVPGMGSTVWLIVPDYTSRSSTGQSRVGGPMLTFMLTGCELRLCGL